MHWMNNPVQASHLMDINAGRKQTIIELVGQKR
jgi:hypothetical protein